MAGGGCTFPLSVAMGAVPEGAPGAAQPGPVAVAGGAYPPGGNVGDAPVVGAGPNGVGVVPAGAAAAPGSVLGTYAELSAGGGVTTGWGAVGSGVAKRICVWPKAIPDPHVQPIASSASRPPIGGLHTKIALPGSCRILPRRYNGGSVSRKSWNRRIVGAGNTKVRPFRQGENAKLEENSRKNLCCRRGTPCRDQVDQ